MNLIIQVFRYVTFASAGAFSIDLLVFNVLHYLFLSPPWVANGIACLSAASFSYFAALRYVFSNCKHSLPRYFMWLCYIVTITAVLSITIQKISDAGYSPFAVKLVSAVPVFCINFIVIKIILGVGDGKKI